ncbi:16S rRNA (guanine(966)-N(2))-methyltransferase RsmD [Marinobacterium lutimaris]|uniref:Ribosomal RNA small subunit methyltransferase D n=1 Tax=Marinobacterium lutimaris TaxID=568106 RepID=A0A1H6D0Q4_9GAMM|nr:16S rRNA (guanine(966)-N(2))-methyltransferase RsmD [Marinobacterium lutimaris]SEG78989.1 16S rRNA m(2)G-966 methyltransferase [Marinobacterium lutimaris]
MSRRNTTRKRPEAAEQAFVRIIGGDWRSRRIPFAAIEGLRPTPDRVRETLFNWLQGVTEGARCVDLCAGSGALGLEALSRGAGSLTFVDQSSLVARTLRENLQKLKVQNAEVVNASALDWLSALPADESERFDLVFMDPPFRKGLVAPLCALLESHNLLSERAMVYVESEKEIGAPDVPESWSLYREKHAGQVSYRLYECSSDHG